MSCALTFGSIPLNAEAPGNALPGSAYTDPDRFALEVSNVFGKEWFCICPVAAIPQPGDYYSFDIAGEPLMAVRGKDNAVRVLTRVCQHRAMLLVEGNGNTARFRCPYHAWTYDTAGEILAVPLMDSAASLAKAKCKLPALRTEIWQGFLFATFAENTAPLAPQLSAISQGVEPFQMDKWVVRQIYSETIDANWKLIVENAAESYHHIAAHQATLQTFMPAQNSRVGLIGERHATHHNLPPDFAIATLASTHSISPDELATLGMTAGEGITSVFPNLTFATSAAGGLFAVILPLAIDRTNFTLWAAAEASSSDNLDRRDDDFTLAFNQEDVTIAAGLAKGVRSRFAYGGPLSPIEKPIAVFYNFLARRMEA